MIEKVNITDSNVTELIRGKLPIATEVKNGLKPAREVQQEKRISMTSSILLFEHDGTNAFSDGILFSVQSYGGGRLPYTSFQYIGQQKSQLPRTVN